MVNALAHEMVSTTKDDLAVDHVMTARETLIHRRETHLDQLADKLREPRVHRVIAPLLAGEAQMTNLQQDDIDYVEDLGLITTEPQLAIANPIYREVIPRMLTLPIQVGLSEQSHWYVTESGRLDMPKLLTAFQQFFREHSEHWTERFQYKEAGAQLLLQAFLQRILNGGGRIEREYGLGRGRTDLLVTLPSAIGDQRIVLELKIQRSGRETTIEKALPQVVAYMDRSGAEEGHLILFDQSDKRWEDKIFRDEHLFEGFAIQIWGM